MADLFQLREAPKEPLDCLYILMTTAGAPFDELELAAKDTKGLRAKMKALEISGTEGELISGESPIPMAHRVNFVGLGEEENISHAQLREVLHKVVHQAAKNREYQIGLACAVQPPGLPAEDCRFFILLESALADYTFDRFRSVKNEFDKIDGLHIVPLKGESQETLEGTLKRVRSFSAAVKTARNLGNRPANDLTPETLGLRCKEIADADSALRLTVFGLKELQKEKMGGIIAVGQGSQHEPRMLILEHRPKKPKRSVVLIGKGITFDTGGISIKPAAGMGWMKYDMCGAAAVIGTMQAVSSLEMPLKVVGLIPAAENMPSSTAIKPGDVITCCNGTTVEIDNTDAEGRLVLADSLAYAKKFNPNVIIDFATLTGSCVVSLGMEAAGMMSNDDELAATLGQLGEEVGERVWRLPLYPEYRDYLKSDWADIKNVGGRWGGVVTAGKFLEHFVPKNIAWAHLDIAGTAYMEKLHNGFQTGATGFGVILALTFLSRILDD